MNISLVKKPSASIPLVMSSIALLLLIGHILLFGIERQADEGAAAHLWQLLMAGQLPIIAFFAIRWLPQNPKQAVFVLALQFIAAMASIAPVFYFNF